VGLQFRRRQDLAWELADDGWEKIESQKSDGIPDFVLPDYAKKH